MITVVNKHTHKPTRNDIYIGRPSVLGNPFYVGRDGDRAQVIAKYRQWLWQQIQAGPENDVFNELMKIVGLTRNGQQINLICFCAPQPCHGDIIVAALNYLMKGVGIAND